MSGLRCNNDEDLLLGTDMLERQGATLDYVMANKLDVDKFFRIPSVMCELRRDHRIAKILGRYAKLINNEELGIMALTLELSICLNSGGWFDHHAR